MTRDQLPPSHVIARGALGVTVLVVATLLLWFAGIHGAGGSAISAGVRFSAWARSVLR